MFITMLYNQTGLYGCYHRATGLLPVQAGGIAAAPPQGFHFREIGSHLFPGDGWQVQAAETRGIGYPPPSGSRISSAWRVVWRPRPPLELTSPVRRLRPGWIALSREDLPTPEGPAKVLSLPARRAFSSSIPWPV